jgi:hypothetical protein
MKTLFFLTLLLFVSYAISQDVDEIREGNGMLTKILDDYMDKSPKDLFKVWHFLYAKEYLLSSDQAKSRFAIFKENLAKIKQINTEQQDYRVGINQFSDLTDEEFSTMYALQTPPEAPEPDDGFLTPVEDDDDDDLTKRVLQNYQPINHIAVMRKPRNQGRCGSCWAYGATGAVEGAFAINKNGGKPLDDYLSTQQLVDCDRNENGCNGGYKDRALNYIKKYGSMKNSDYTYRAVKGTCKYNSNLATYKITGYKYCSIYSSNKSYRCSFDKQYNLLSKGPLNVGIDGMTFAFRHYKSGIFTGSCYKHNHIVVNVGYGVSDAGTQYFIIRNSWGPTWGEKGHIKVKINVNNKNSCFIGNDAYLPTV